MASRLLLTLGCAVLLAGAGCGQAAPVANRAPDRASPAAATPVPTPVATPTPVPPTPTPAPTPVPPALSLAFGAGSVTVSVTGIANGAHQVHVHRDCTGNPNLHLTTLGTVFVNPDGAGSQTFALAPSLRGRGFDLLVYPLGASQGPPSLCAAV